MLTKRHENFYQHFSFRIPPELITFLVARVKNTCEFLNTLITFGTKKEFRYFYNIYSNYFFKQNLSCGNFEYPNKAFWRYLVWSIQLTVSGDKKMNE